MKNLKFRVWDKRFEKMDYGRGDLLLRVNNEDFSEVMQYTGIEDKNGTEIYEGDIIEIQGIFSSPDYPYDEFEELDKRFVVAFKDGCFYLKEPNIKGVWCYFEHLVSQFDRYNSIKVIGNIYENSELLKE